MNYETVLNLIETIAVKQGWNTQSKYELCLMFIANHCNIKRFEAFLEGIVNNENRYNVEENG